MRHNQKNRREAKSKTGEDKQKIKTIKSFSDTGKNG